VRQVRNALFARQWLNQFVNPLPDSHPEVVRKTGMEGVAHLFRRALCPRHFQCGCPSFRDVCERVGSRGELNRERRVGAPFSGPERMLDSPRGPPSLWVSRNASFQNEMRAFNWNCLGPIVVVLMKDELVGTPLAKATPVFGTPKLGWLKML
jgi:hypothetical protein